MILIPLLNDDSSRGPDDYVMTSFDIGVNYMLLFGGIWMILRSFRLGVSVRSGTLVYRGILMTRKVPVSSIIAITDGEDLIFSNLTDFFLTIPALEIEGKRFPLVMSSSVVTIFSADKMSEDLHRLLGLTEQPHES